MQTVTRLPVRLPDQWDGVVESVDDDVVRVRGAVGVLRCQRAASCLLAPGEGDRVLVATVGATECWVLAVLSRAETAGPAVLETPGDCALRVPAGRLVVSARDGVTVGTAGALRVSADVLDAHAREGSLVMGALKAVAETVEGEVGALRGRFGALDTVAERVSSRARRVYRWVEEFEQLRARRVDWHMKETAQIHAREALVTAEGLVKIDGAQIHVG
jgi:hypothetical protein